VRAGRGQAVRGRRSGEQVEDAETGEQLFIDTHDSGFRRRFMQAAEQREYQLGATFNRLGIDVLELSTDADLVEEIVRFTVLRKKRRKSPAVSGQRNLVRTAQDSILK